MLKEERKLYNELKKAEESKKAEDRYNNLSADNLKRIEAFKKQYNFNKAITMNGFDYSNIDNFKNKLISEIGIGKQDTYEIWVHDYSVSVCCPTAVKAVDKKYHPFLSLSCKAYKTKRVYVFDTLEKALAYTSVQLQQDAIQKTLDDATVKAVQQLKAEADKQRIEAKKQKRQEAK